MFTSDRDVHQPPDGAGIVKDKTDQVSSLNYLFNISRHFFSLSFISVLTGSLVSNGHLQNTRFLSLNC